MKTLLIILMSNISLAAPIQVLPQKNTKKINGDEVKTTQASTISKTKMKKTKTSNLNDKGRNAMQTEENDEIKEIKKLDKNNQDELKTYLSKNAFAVWDYTSSYDVKTGTAIKAILLNSVVSSNLDSPLLAETTEDYKGVPKGTKFSCIGVTKNRRVLTSCNRMITESDEFEVDTILLNTDGTAGLMGELYSGKNEYMVGALTAATLSGVFDASLDTTPTPLGTEVLQHSMKNKMKSGAIGALDEITQLNTDELKTKEPKISMNAGKEVLIYFNKRFKN